MEPSLRGREHELGDLRYHHEGYVLLGYYYAVTTVATIGLIGVASGNARTSTATTTTTGTRYPPPFRIGT